MNYRKNNGSKILSGILAVLLVLVIAAGVVGIGYVSDWFTDWTKFEQEQPADEEQGGEETVNGGAVISGSMENGVSLMSAKIATADYAANDISPLAETAYTLTASVYPEKYASAGVDWSVAFANTDSENTWGDNKTVTDYVTVTPTSDGALTATVECVAAFGEQIIVTCTSRNNAYVSATCTVDYQQIFDDSFFIDDEEVEDGAYIPVTVDVAPEYRSDCYKSIKVDCFSSVYTIPLEDYDSLLSSAAFSIVPTEYLVNIGLESSIKFDAEEVEETFLRKFNSIDSDGVGNFHSTLDFCLSDEGNSLVHTDIRNYQSQDFGLQALELKYSMAAEQNNRNVDNFASGATMYGWSFTFSCGDYSRTVYFYVSEVVNSSSAATDIGLSSDSLIF